MTDDLQRSAHELAADIARKALSPVELIAATLARIEADNARLNAICARLDAQAMAAAHAAEAAVMAGDPIGPLHGVPVVIKEITPMAGIRCTYASVVYADHFADSDALVVARLKAAGAIIVGRSNASEFGAGAHTVNPLFGATCNPHDVKRTAGGSTGGGAVALQAGMAALAEGTDLGGSLRIPAAFCGVCGLRPTPGRVPVVPSPQPWDDLNTEGPMARNCTDLALMLDVLSGAAPSAPLSAGRAASACFSRLPDARALRLAYAPDPSGLGCDQTIGTSCAAAAASLGATPIALDLSPLRQAFLTLRGLWMLREHHQRLHLRDQFGPNLRGNIEHGLSLSARDIAEAEAVRADALDRLVRVFEDVDVLLCPTTAVSPFPIDWNHPQTINGQPLGHYIEWAAPTYVFSALGVPALSVPCGVDDDGLPVGLQIVARPWCEADALAVGVWLETLTT
ncbi:MAG: amidase [Geminicoccaceae bacterium]